MILINKIFPRDKDKSVNLIIKRPPIEVVSGIMICVKLDSGFNFEHKIASCYPISSFSQFIQSTNPDSVVNNGDPDSILEENEINIMKGKGYKVLRLENLGDDVLSELNKREVTGGIVELVS